MNDWIIEGLRLDSAITGIERINDGLYIITTAVGCSYILRWVGCDVTVEKQDD